MWRPLASITLRHLRLHEEINLLISCRVILFHSSWRAFHNCSVVFGFLALEWSRDFHILSRIKIWALRRPIHNSIIFCLEEVHGYQSLVTWDIVLHEYGRLLRWISQHRQDMIFTSCFKLQHLPFLVIAPKGPHHFQISSPKPWHFLHRI